MSYCPGCGAVNEFPAQNCGACGRVLAVICPQCQSYNSPSAKFCHGCGRILAQHAPGSIKGVKGEPISDMVRPQASFVVADAPPRNSMVKAFTGSAVFALLFFSQVLQGYPFFGIACGLASGAIAFWGFIEIAVWAMERAESRSYQGEEVYYEDEEFPVAPAKGTGSTEGSFADLDEEVSDHPSQSRVMEKPKGLVASMVSGIVDSESAKSSSIKKDQKPASFVGDQVDEERGKEVSLISPEETKEATERAQKAESLIQFLDDGVIAEISHVEKKLEKSPRNFSLLMKLAQLHEERGESSKALEIMDRCIALNPQSPDIYLFQGILLKRANEPGKARNAFQRALAMNRFMSKAHYQLGVLERGVRDFSSAKEHFDGSIQPSPDDAYSHYQLGMVYRETGELNLAQMELKRATLLNPNDSYGHSQLGQIFQQTRQWDAAVLEYSQALSIKSSDAFVLVKLGEVLLEKGELGRAQEIFQEALAQQFHPDEKVMLQLARIYHKLGKFKELKPIVEDILRVSPDQPDASFYLATCLADEKDYPTAIRTFNRVTVSNPEKWEVWLELGKLYQTMNYPDEALSAYIKASPNATDQAGVWNTIGVLLTNKKDYEGALKAFKKAVAHDFSDIQIQTNYKAVQKKVESAAKKTIEQASDKLSQDPKALGAYLEMGHAYELIDRPDEALMTYQRLLSIKPDEISGLLAYAELLKTRGKLKMAMRCYREVTKLQPGNFEAALQLIKANLNLGFINEALKLATGSQKLAPDDMRIHFLLGKIYFTKGLAPRALKEFSIVTEKATDPEMVSWAELMRRRLTKSI